MGRKSLVDRGDELLHRTRTASSYCGLCSVHQALELSASSPSKKAMAAGGNPRNAMAGRYRRAHRKLTGDPQGGLMRKAQGGATRSEPDATTRPGAPRRPRRRCPFDRPVRGPARGRRDPAAAAVRPRRRRCPRPRSPPRRRWATPGLAAAVVAGLLGGRAGCGHRPGARRPTRRPSSRLEPSPRRPRQPGRAGRSTGGLGDIQAVRPPAQTGRASEIARRRSPCRDRSGSLPATASQYRHCRRHLGRSATTDGLVVTNAHVVDGADTVEVSAHRWPDLHGDGRRVARHHPRTLRGAVQPRRALVETFRRHARPHQPSGGLAGHHYCTSLLDLRRRALTVTTGIVSSSADRTRGDHHSRRRSTDLIQTDAAINSGNSAGRSVSTDGTVIGMNTAVAGDAQNIGFAVSAATIQQVLAGVPANSAD